MEHFVAYHKIDERGEYLNTSNQFNHFSRKAKSLLEQALKKRVWVVTGKNSEAGNIYHLCASFTPIELKHYSENRELIGPGIQFIPQVHLNPYPWFQTLRDEQANFSLGLNRIKSESVISHLNRLEEQDAEVRQSPDEIDSEIHIEGATKRVTVNAYERDRQARSKCIEHYGCKCFVCNFDVEKQYGAIGKGLIHVHHLTPLSEIGQAYQVDPIKDLRPVCPNCHAVIHSAKPYYDIEDIQTSLTVKFNDDLQASTNDLNSDS